MKKTKEIIVKRKGDEYHAHVEGHPEMWEAGKDYRFAVGKLIVGHPEEFGIVVMMETNKEKAINILKNAYFATPVPNTNIDTTPRF